ncbi:MAG: TonB-dependent receptor [Bacteroidetes bacterium]|nr:TonB-dependent receptor [Bacteroidota bacterium]
MNIQLRKYLTLTMQCTATALLLLASGTLFAQKDTTKKTTTIDITSAYKPVLRNSVKINFTAAYLNADTSKPKMNYTVPPQNLFYAYQPISLKPLALQQDTNLDLGIRNYIKAGFGNFSTPYVNAGFSFGDGKKSLLNVYADYISSKGKIKYQDFSQLNLKGAGSYFTAKNEAYGEVKFSQNDTYLYGYDHTLHNFSKDSILTQYQDINLKAGIRNTVVGDFGLKYNPTVQVDNFTGKNKLSESSLIVNAPIEKQFGEAFALKVEGRADITSYTTKNLTNNVKLSNNVFQLSPSLIFASPQFSINGGLTPTWDNGNFVWLPNVYAEAQIKEKVFMIQAGWVGNYVKNTFHNLIAINPYLQTIASQTNTKEIEYYGGIKATLSKHFNFSAKAGLLSYTNFALFINDTASDGKSFKTVYEPKANNFRVHGDLSYINQDKFTLTTGLTLNGYTGFNTNAKAWNTVPLELTSSLRWWAYKQVLLKGDFYMFGGGNYIDKGNVTKSFKGGTDLSAGLEFRVNKMFSAWLDVNNILNNKYERWHNYQVYGLNVLGGVRVMF